MLNFLKRRTVKNNQVPKTLTEAEKKTQSIQSIKEDLLSFYSEPKRTHNVDTWKNVIDDTDFINHLFKLDSVSFNMVFTKIEDRLEDMIKVHSDRYEISISDSEKNAILAELKPITKTGEELLVLETKNLMDRFKKVITPANVNTYVEYSPEFKEDKYPLWRPAEKFTPALYLAKVSPLCSESMLLVLLKAGASLSMRAATVGCLSYPSLQRPFYKKRHCTTIGKLARKVYFIGKSDTVIPKLHTMYACLKDLNNGVFLEKRKYLSENPELTRGIDFNFYKVDLTQSLLKRSWRCRYLDHLTKPNTSLKGCGIPGISKYSESFQKLEIPRLGKLFLGVGACAGTIAAPIMIGAALTGVVIIPGGVIIIPAAIIFIIGVAHAAKKIGNSKIWTITYIDMANKTSAEVLKNNQDMLLGLAKKEIAKAPEEKEEPAETKKTGGLRKNKTRRA